MKHITLTPAVSIATHSRLRALAKSNKIPLRALCALLIERAVADVESGKLAIRPPTLTTAKP